MNWENVVKQISPYVVKIETPSGSGTGYLCTWRAPKTWCGVATAYHVIAEADTWQQPIKIHSKDFSRNKFLREAERFIWTDPVLDSAVIFFDPSDLELPEKTIPLVSKENPLSIGSEVGWLGFPSIDPYTLCFFSGAVSARRDDNRTYLIDGVAINGVSGGPVFFLSSTDGTQFVGIVSAYRANRQRGDALPGLLIAQDVSHAHFVIDSMRSFDEAKAKKAEEEAKKKEQPPAPVIPPDATPEPPPVQP